MDQGRSHRRIDAPREPANHLLSFAQALSNAFGLFIDRSRRRPVALAFANVEQKIAQNLRPQWRVRNLWMKLQTVKATRGILESIDRFSRARSYTKPVRERRNFIAVTHPD